MARHARQTGHGEDARRQLRRALKKAPDHGEGWSLLGELEAERDKPAQALAAWEKAVAAEPRLAGELYPRIEASYAARGKPGEFEKGLRGRLEEHPGDAPARMALTRTLAARGDTSEALAEIGGLLEAEPDRLEAHALRAEILLRDDREAEAAVALGELRTALDRLGLLPLRETLG
jgi:lipopolysaccharide biosynthesis regulator YciM